MRGSFITFEGGEGSGKSTQIKLLSEAFATAGKPCIATREPGGTESAERIRNLLVSGEGNAWSPVSETLMFYAARVEHVTRKIMPALEQGTHVLCDRFADSTLVYQGAGKDLPEEFILSLHRLVLGNFAPNLTIILDIDPEVGLQRAQARHGDENRFEMLGLDFHRRIRSGFLNLATREPKRCVVVDANQDVAALHQSVTKVIHNHLGIAF